MNPRLAICIPTYNQGRYLRQAVDSALGQRGADLEIWISDDASTDNTAEIAQQLAADHPQLRYHRHDRNLGLCANNNWVLSQPVTEWILRLDSDDMLLPTYVETLLPMLAAQPKAAYAHAAVCEIDEDSVPGRIRRLRRTPGFQTASEALRGMAHGYRVAANICLFRAAALREQKFYRPGLNFAEDWDLAVRLAAGGWGNVYSGDILASYRVWKTPQRASFARKASEIAGCTAVFEDSLSPAFGRQGWNSSELPSCRQRLAATHAAHLDSPDLTPAERSELVQLLRELGDGWPLRWHLLLLNLGLGGMVRRASGLKVRLKDMLKRLLHSSGGGSPSSHPEIRPQN